MKLNEIKPSILIVAIIGTLLLTFTLGRFSKKVPEPNKDYKAEYDSVMALFVEYDKRFAEMQKVDKVLGDNVERDESLLKDAGKKVKRRKFRNSDEKLKDSMKQKILSWGRNRDW